MSTICLGSRFKTKNLTTGEIEEWIIKEPTITQRPVFDNNKRNRISYVTSTIVEQMEDANVQAISEISPLGRILIDRPLGYIFDWQDGAAITAKYQVIEIDGEQLHVELAVPSLGERTYCESTTGLELLIAHGISDELLILHSDYWTNDFCFVVESFGYDDFGHLRLLGTTFLDGVVYYRDAKYPADREFDIFTGEKTEKIQFAYKHFPKRFEKRDPVELTPEFEAAMEAIESMIREEIGEQEYEGYEYLYWAVQKDLLKAKYNIDWNSPKELNPEKYQNSVY